ncbi:hypothetical protein ACUT50_001672, partial [Vibrio cholerae]
MLSSSLMTTTAVPELTPSPKFTVMFAFSVPLMSSALLPVLSVMLTVGCVMLPSSSPSSPYT